MPSSYYSLVPVNQKPYATLWPWYQKPCDDQPILIQEQLESFITQILSEGELAKAPSSNAVYQLFTQVINNLARTNIENVFEQSNTFSTPIHSPINVDIANNNNAKFIPNAESIKNYVMNINFGDIDNIQNYIGSLFNSYFYKSEIASTTHTIYHNLNSDNIEYTVLVFDENLHIYKNDIVSVSEINNNTLIIESSEAVNIKMSVRSVITV